MDNIITVNINNLTQEERNQIKKKRKFRAMTIRERCFNSKFTPCKDCEYRSGIRCQYP